MSRKIVSYLLLLVLVISSCSDEIHIKIPKAPAAIDLSTSFYYEINLNDRSEDSFEVRMFVDNLTEANAVFQFPATVPGTYDIHDIGRFVTAFKAYDGNYKELSVTHTITNQWVLSDPINTGIIEFEVKETFDTPVTENNIYKMAGTSIENDHVLFNTFDVLGFPTGLKARDFYLNIDYPSSWLIGTSLEKNSDGLYYAADYDRLVDNPLLMGKITSATTTVDNANISVYSYSKANLIQASQVLADVQSILDDASAFLNGLPVDHYSFLYFFDEFSAGALEHSYSSVYVLRDQPYTSGYGQSIRNISAHEFFHIVVPLNIHSEIIGNFNFATPTASQHLWLYEGVTEWAAHMMQYRHQSIDLGTLFSRLETKKNVADSYNQAISLTEMSETVYGIGGFQFGNVYNKGALVATLLDIRLLELSNGTKGLRELILQLINTYGPDNAFSETTFFADLVSLTYPEMTDFFDRYVKGTDPLPLQEYFNKIGVDYDPNNNLFSINPNLTTQQQALFDKWSVNF